MRPRLEGRKRSGRKRRGEARTGLRGGGERGLAPHRVHPGQGRVGKTDKNGAGTKKMGGGRGGPLADKPLPSLTNPEERKKIAAKWLALYWVLFIILSFLPPKYNVRMVVLA